MTERWDGAPKTEIRRHWESSKDDSRIRCYLGMQGRMPLDALIRHLGEVAPGRSLDQFGINFATVVWIDAPTDAETTTRAHGRARHDERHAAWERETYERLKAKFEPDLGVGDQT